LKFASEIIDLMGAYPGRDFRMVQIVRYVANGRTLDLKERRAARKAVLRALEALVASGSVLLTPPTASRGAPVFYRWKSET
jgi:hypothetical protein